MNRVFVDTNVLIYADQRRSAAHGRAREALAALGREGAELWSGRQVLREYLAVVTRPGPDGIAPMTRAEAAEAVEAFATAYQVAEDGPAATAVLLDLLRSVPVGGRQVHDANIAATMVAHGIPRLLTFNAADFRRFARVVALVGA